MASTNSTLSNNIAQNQTSTDYRFTLVRSDDGNAVITLQHLVMVNGVAQWQTAKDTSQNGSPAVTQSNAGWDDAIPWNASTYDLTYAGTYVTSTAASWRIPDGEIAGRDGIRLHLGSQATPSQALEGCIGANAAFLLEAQDVLTAAGEINATESIPLVVTDSGSTALSPIYINESVSTSSISPGQSATVTFTLVGGGTADGITKDIFLYVPITATAQAGSAVYGQDYTITSTDGGSVSTKYLNTPGSHLGATWPAGYYLKLPKGQSSVTYTVTANANAMLTTNEAVNLTATDYYVTRVLGSVTTDYSDHLDSPKILLQGGTLNGAITIGPSATLTTDHISGDIAGVLKTYTVHLGDTISYDFQAYTIPDFLSITDGSAVYGTGGFVSYDNPGSFVAATNSITVKVVGSAQGTAWDLDLTDTPATTTSPSQSPAVPDTITPTAAVTEVAPQTATAAVPAVATTAPTLSLVSSTNVTVAAGGQNQTVSFQAAAGQKYLVRLLGAELNPVPGALSNGTLTAYEGASNTPLIISTGSDLDGEPAAVLTIATAETVSLVAGAGTVGGGNATIQVYNDSSAAGPILYLTPDATDTENRGDEQGITIIAERAGDLSQAATYQLDITPSGSNPVTAADVDGGLLTRPITFAAGSDIASTIIYPQPSATLTGNRTATVSLDAASLPAASLANATLLGLSQSVGITITDELPNTTAIVPYLAASDSSGTPASGEVIFTVALAQAASNPVSVSYITNDVTAMAGQDYTQQSGTLTFAPGEVTKQVAVTLLGATTGGTDKTFQLNLLSPTGATLPAGGSVLTQTGTVLESTASIASTQATVTGAGGTVRTLTFTSAALASQAQAQLSAVSAAIQAGSITANAVSGSSLPTLAAGAFGLGEIDSSGTVSMPANYVAAVDLATGPVSLIGAASGSHVVVAESGDFTYGAVSGADTIYAGAGNALIFGNSASLNVYGGAGPDSIVGGTGGNTVTGGTGTTLMFATGAASYQGGAGAATVIGGSSGLVANMGAGGGVVFGSPNGGDLLTAASGNATLVGGGNGDVVTANTSGNDVLIAGNGAEMLNGAAATNGLVLFGGTGADSIIGGTGGDLFLAGSGNETMTGGGGNNAYAFVAAPGSTRVDTISDFDPNRNAIGLYNYGSNADATALASITVTGGNTVIGLPDGTTIVLTGAPTLTHYNFF